MHKLMAQGVISLCQGQSYGHDDPVLHSFSNTSRTCSDKAADSIGLLKISVIVIKYQWILPGERIPENCLMNAEPLL